ncbi:MAG: hypothetical protein DMG28_03795 [Acidobacteria bacterium]|nr:MAG: hypothetical protein DMG28_03795 [Acidobacteriota bacterium]
MPRPVLFIFKMSAEGRLLKGGGLAASNLMECLSEALAIILVRGAKEVFATTFELLVRFPLHNFVFQNVRIRVFRGTQQQGKADRVEKSIGHLIRL